ncbi:hypothetical protein [Chryseobacterium gwangjuense]|uniref:hypothetical protein n=1 Tax=Chryseobacterium gwangjuense TaxID=1069980 RepID=UPI001E500307|nr:hypothetical protein [Chryseobacterium gwangjuense]MCE3075089.1 hypothetical protein [Chryseobacterium gwangjuense]
MKILKTAFLVLGALTTILSCRNDDEDNADNFNMNRKVENIELQASREIKDSIYNTTNGDQTSFDTIKPGGTHKAVLDSLKKVSR